MQSLYVIKLNGKQFGKKIYQSRVQAQAALAELFEASERRLRRAFRSGNLRGINGLQTLNRTLRNGLTVEPYLCEGPPPSIEAPVEQGKQSANKRLSRMHRNYTDI